MYPPRREGPLLALLMLATAFVPLGAGAQEPEKPPVDKQEERQEERREERERLREQAEEEQPKEIETKDATGKEWITPDVGAAEEEEEENEVGDVDEVIIEYGATTDMEQEDKVTDAKGKEIEDIATPVVSKAVKIQDPDKLEPGADKETGVQGQVVSRRKHLYAVRAAQNVWPWELDEYRLVEVRVADHQLPFGKSGQFLLCGVCEHLVTRCRKLIHIHTPVDACSAVAHDSFVHLASELLRGKQHQTKVAPALGYIQKGLAQIRVLAFRRRVFV